MPRYWVSRTDKENRELLLGELRAGHLRQGWGYADDQDLQLVQHEVEIGGAWWVRLTETQKETLPHRRMLSDFDDSIQVGDLIIVPNLPEYGWFMIVEVTGPYDYEPLQLAAATDVNDLDQDYGHKLPIRIITPDGVNKFAEDVDARLRSTLRTPMRTWNIDNYAGMVNRIVAAVQRGADVQGATTGVGRLETAWGRALAATADTLVAQLADQLDERFQAAEWEEPITRVLKSLYPKSDVLWTGGPSENGADILVKIPDHFGSGLPWIVMIQVKNYTGEIGADVLGQLERAHANYIQEGKLLTLVVMTTAETASEELTAGANALAARLGVPVEIVLRKKTIQMLRDGLMEMMGLKPE